MSTPRIKAWCYVCDGLFSCDHLNPPDRSSEDNETRYRRLLAEYENRRRGRCDWCGDSGSHDLRCEAFFPDGRVR